MGKLVSLARVRTQRRARGAIAPSVVCRSAARRRRSAAATPAGTAAGRPAAPSLSSSLGVQQPRTSGSSSEQLTSHGLRMAEGNYRGRAPRWTPVKGQAFPPRFTSQSLPRYLNGRLSSLVSAASPPIISRLCSLDFLCRTVEPLSANFVIPYLPRIPSPND